MSYKIGSFNLCNFNVSSDKETKKSFETIAQIIRNEDYDIIALQEILSELAMKQLMQHLGATWDYRFMPAPLRSNDNRGEGYAYIWNTRRVGLVQTKTDNGIRTAEPRIWKQYSRVNGEMIREPYVARFTPCGKAGGAFFEIRLINTHLIFGKTVGDRKNEFEMLVGNLFENIANRRTGNNMPSYTVILGDYNLEIDACKKIEDALNLQSRYPTITVQNELTTLKAVRIDENGNRVCDGYSHNYDHFTYEIKNSSIFTGSKIYAVEKYYGNSPEDFTKYHDEISDHTPIALEIDLREGR